jgi:hypothetical protein
VRLGEWVMTDVFVRQENVEQGMAGVWHIGPFKRLGQMTEAKCGQFVYPQSDARRNLRLTYSWYADKGNICQECMRLHKVWAND